MKCNARAYSIKHRRKTTDRIYIFSLAIKRTLSPLLTLKPCGCIVYVQVPSGTTRVTKPRPWMAHVYFMSFPSDALDLGVSDGSQKEIETCSPGTPTNSTMTSVPVVATALILCSDTGTSLSISPSRTHPFTSRGAICHRPKSDRPHTDRLIGCDWSNVAGFEDILWG